MTLKKTVDGTTTDVETVTVGAEDNWSKTWSGLAVKEGGKTISYSVVEVLETANDYTSDTTTAVVVANGGSKTITNSHTPGTTSISITKTWADDSNAAGLRPTAAQYKAKIHLWAGSTEVTTTYADKLTVTDNGNNTYTVAYTELPEKAAGMAIAYKITEDAVDAYIPSTTEALEDGDTLTNTQVGDLVVKKTVVSNTESDKTKKFDFTVTLETNLTGTYGQMEFTEGVATFQLADGETKTATGLPADTVYHVSEADADGFTKTPGSAVSGTIDADEHTVTFKNTRNEGNLAVKKTVATASLKEPNKAFKFTVTLKSGNDVATDVDGTYGDMKFDEGVATVEVKGGETKTAKNLPALLTYEVVETTYDGWTLSSHSNPSGTIDANGTKTATFTNTYSAAGKVQLSAKKVLEGAELTAGKFSFQLKDADGKVLQTKTNAADGSVTFDEIAYTLADVKNSPITYTIVEVKGNDKTLVYDAHTETITVTLTDNGDGTIQAKADKTGAAVKFTNKVTSVKVSKVDVTDQKELEGAKIQIVDKDGNVVKEWTSTTTPEEITGLKTGEEYTLKETVAPEGYTITTDTKFSINEDGTVNRITGNISEEGVILVEDAKTSVKVSKVDIDGGKELEGAKIQIKDKDGKVVAEWTSGKEAHEVTGLKTGVTYTLHEEVAPDGYTIAADTTFTIDAKGNVTTTGKKTDGGVLLIEDAQTSVKISKVDVTDQKELEGAKIQILDKDGKVVKEWTSKTTPEEIKGLKTGEEYTLHETVAPQGYDLTTDTKFSINADGTVNRITGNINKDGVILVEDSKTVVVTNTPAPTATPAPGPTSVTGKKIWLDENNLYGTRPDSITVQLYANGALVEDATPTWTGTKTNAWTFTFANLPSVNANGATINYTVKEVPVENYETTINGTTITNKLIPKESKEFTDLSGVKTWDDNDNASGQRPTSITVHLLRNGVEVESCTVTAADGWKYSFSNQPVDTGYGTDYKYEVREDAVPGYFSLSNGLNLTNRLLHTDKPNNGDNEFPFDDNLVVKSRRTASYRPKFERMGEEEFDDLLDILDYGTPLFGMMGTGDEIPAYPFVFGGIGALAVVAYILVKRRKRRTA